MKKLSFAADEAADLGLLGGGLVLREVSGRVHHLRLSPKAMETAASWIETQTRYWNAALDRLDAYLASTSKKDKK